MPQCAVCRAPRPGAMRAPVLLVVLLCASAPLLCSAQTADEAAALANTALHEPLAGGVIEMRSARRAKHRDAAAMKYEQTEAAEVVEEASAGELPAEEVKLTGLEGQPLEDAVQAVSSARHRKPAGRAQAHPLASRSHL